LLTLGAREKAQGNSGQADEGNEMFGFIKNVFDTDSKKTGSSHPESSASAKSSHPEGMKFKAITTRAQSKKAARMTLERILEKASRY
jgi:hypothetical protein